MPIATVVIALNYHPKQNRLLLQVYKHSNSHCKNANFELVEEKHKQVFQVITKIPESRLQKRALLQFKGEKDSGLRGEISEEG